MEQYVLYNQRIMKNSELDYYKNEMLDYRKKFILAHNELIKRHQIALVLLLIPIPFILPIYLIIQHGKYLKHLKGQSKDEY